MAKPPLRKLPASAIVIYPLLNGRFGCCRWFGSIATTRNCCYSSSYLWFIVPDHSLANPVGCWFPWLKTPFGSPVPSPDPQLLCSSSDLLPVPSPTSMALQPTRMAVPRCPLPFAPFPGWADGSLCSLPGIACLTLGGHCLVPAYLCRTLFPLLQPCLAPCLSLVCPCCPCPCWDPLPSPCPCPCAQPPCPCCP